MTSFQHFLITAIETHNYMLRIHENERPIHRDRVVADLRRLSCGFVFTMTGMRGYQELVIKGGFRRPTCISLGQDLNAHLHYLIEALTCKSEISDDQFRALWKRPLIDALRGRIKELLKHRKEIIERLVS